jgi:hypothetical protein
MLLLVPSTLMGQTEGDQTSGAILHSKGGVWINGSEARDASAVFAGDFIETKAGFSATLNLDGTSILLGSESVAKFQGDFLELSHGTVSVGTSKSFRVHVNCLRVVPVLNEWTQYEVTDVSGSVQVSARKDDVNVERSAAHRNAGGVPEASQRASVHEGEQHSYNETELCGVPAAPTSAGSTLSPKWIIIGTGAGAGLLCALLCGGHGGPTKTPLSAAAP